MNGRTSAYLDIAAVPTVGAALLDPRPAFVFRGDGSSVLWANAAGVAFLGAASMTELLDRRFAPAGPFAAQIQRLAKQTPTDHPRLEILRFTLGVSQTALPAACQRLDLDGARALFTIAAGNAARESLSTRAERLADAIAGDDCLAALLDADGKVLGASGGFDRLASASDEVDAMIDQLAAGGDAVVKRAIAVDGGVRAVGAARVSVGGDRLFLLIIGPEEARAPRAETAKRPETAVAVTPSAPVPPASEPASSPPVAAVAKAAAEPERASPPTTRFLWQMDRNLRFVLVSPELAALVGERTSAIAGKSWREVDEALRLDASGAVTAALSRQTNWDGLRVHWPVSEALERVAIDLSALAVHGAGGFGGYRGFGVIFPDVRRPDDRPAPANLTAVPPAPETAEAVPAAPVPTAEAPPPAAIAPPPAPPAEPVPAPRRRPKPAVGEEIDDVARRSIESGSRSPQPDDLRPDLPEAIEPSAAPMVPPEAEEKRSNVVRLPGTPTRALPRRLTGTEQDAFRRIAEALGSRAGETRGDATPARPPETSPEEPAPTASAPAPEPVPSPTQLLDKLDLGVAIYRDGRTFYANRALLDLLGYDGLDEFVAAGGADALFAGGADRLSDGGTFAARRREGGTVTVDAKLQAVPFAGATALMLSAAAHVEPPPTPPAEPAAPPDGVGTDRIAELEAILDTATDGVIVLDATGKIVTVNHAAEALFGIVADQVSGKSFVTLLAEESRKPALDYLDGLSSNGVASVLNDGREVIGRVPRGGLIPLFMTMGRIGDSGKYCAVLRDITHWKNVEEELVAARRAAEAANAQKSDFLAKISHEIRTPLNAIIGFSEVMIEQRFGPIGNDRYRDYLRDIHLSGQHLMSLINDLLDLSKIEAGKLDLTFESVSVNEVVQECVALMQPQANRERIIIRTSLASGVPNVVADLRSLRQILLNLLSNAIKFTRAGGQVIVATALEESGEVVLRIRDTGIGMTEKDIETAMKPFRQIATSGRAREGTGLGLPLTKALVEANRATFSIDSVPNQGTLVRITFPTTRVLAG